MTEAADGTTFAHTLADGDGVALSERPGQRLALAAFLPLAAAISAALAQLHKHGVNHHKLAPQHILVDPAGLVRLSGVGAAPAGPMACAFPYMSPEQTGRMNCAADARSDLYSLGVILYQLLTGALPFTAFDAAGWMHCHVAREPVAPHERCPGVDPMASRIVFRLLAKEAEQRYQSAAGLHADLLHCQALLAAHGAVDAFAPGLHDGVACLHAPRRLAGRALQVALLEAAAARAGAPAAADVTPELLLVSGRAGVGKSALIAALQQAGSMRAATIVSGKCDQYQCDIPYAALAQAFQRLVRQLLGQGEAQLDARRRALLAALGPNARLMLDLIPELKFVIGEHEAPPALAPFEAQGRFHAVFRQFLGAFARPGVPLLVCLDDMQWIDTASLKLLAHLHTHAGAPHVLVLGACRSDEAGPGHRLEEALAAMRAQGALVGQVEVGDLAPPELGELVADALDCPLPAAAGLAALVFAKTAGNPFFARQFLTGLVERTLLRFDGAAGAWQWDADAIAAQQFSDNVAALLVARIEQLPRASLELLKLLACLGQDATLDKIALVSGMSGSETDECLWPAARLGLVVREPKGYRFMHDRVREGAYSLVPVADRAGRHLHIGTLLLEHAGEAALGDEVFAIVHHLNRARPDLKDAALLSRLAGLNAAAGAKARNAVAFDSARAYLELAAALTPERHWRTECEATFALYLALAECEYLCGNLARADDLFALLDRQARTRLDSGRIAILRVALYQVSGRFDRAVEVALAALALFGMRFPEADEHMAEALESERAAVEGGMAGRAIGELMDAAPATDPETPVVSALLSEMGSSVFSARPALYPLLAARALNFTLQSGATETSCNHYSRYAILLVSVGAVAEAFEYSELALRMARGAQPPSKRIGRLCLVHGAYVHSWRQPVGASVAMLEQAFDACQDAGDLPHAGYAAHIATWNSFEAGAPLAGVRQRTRRYLAFARQHHYGVLVQLLRCYEQLTLCLQGATHAEGGFDDDSFSAAHALAVFEQARFGAATARYHLMRQIAAFTFGRYDEALHAADAAGGELHFMLASLNEASHHFYHALTLAALYPDAAPGQRQRYMAALRAKQYKLRTWSLQCPSNFDHRCLLLAAELARIEGRQGDAMHGYDAAIASARMHGFIQGEALAGELAAAFHHGRGAHEVGRMHAREALQAYRTWGAHGKVRQLERRFPDSAGHAAPDLLAALRSVTESAGAGRSLLLLAGETGRVRAVAQVCTGRAGVVAERIDCAPDAAMLPEAVLQFVLRTGETVLLDDAAACAQFASDPYIALAHPRSLLCMALLEQGRLAAVLYLENRLAPGVFAREAGIDTASGAARLLQALHG